MNSGNLSNNLEDNIKGEIPTPPPEPKHPIGFIKPEELKGSIRTDGKLGQGSFGSIWRITYKPTGLIYAMKCVRKTTNSVRGMALREAKIGMGISHPNVCQTYAWSEDADMVYIIMEYIEGMDLFEFIFKNPGIFQKKLDFLWFVITCILHGLAAIHHKGFVHCDIKPENVLIGLSPDKQNVTSVKILDFGLSRPIADIQQCAAGTHDYMAPEVATPGAYKDARLDIWSFGVLMYAMFMTGIPSQIHSLHQDANLRKAEVIQNLCSLTTDEFKPFTRISSQEKYARIQGFIMSCLRVNQLERPTSQELLAKIRDFFPPVAVEKKDA